MASRPSRVSPTLGPSSNEHAAGRSLSGSSTKDWTKALLPQEYQPEPSTGFGVSRPELRSMLSKTERTRRWAVANVYLDPDQRFGTTSSAS